MDQKYSVIKDLRELITKLQSTVKEDQKWAKNTYATTLSNDMQMRKLIDSNTMAVAKQTGVFARLVDDFAGLVLQIDAACLKEEIPDCLRLMRESLQEFQAAVLKPPPQQLIHQVPTRDLIAELHRRSVEDVWVDSDGTVREGHN